ncbi:MAG: CHASE domain-containing protein [Cyanophyceae cyanobacterium]
MTENNLQGGIRRAEDRTGYFPVTFIEPLQPNRLALGFDLASDPIRWQSLEQARQQSTIVVSQRIELVQDPDQGLGFLVILPIYIHHPHDSGETLPAQTLPAQTLPAQTLHGFIIGVFRLVDILKSAIQGLDLDRIDILLRDLSAPLTAGFLAYYSSHPAAVMADRSTEATLDRRLNGWEVICHQWGF